MSDNNEVFEWGEIRTLLIALRDRAVADCTAILTYTQDFADRTGGLRIGQYLRFSYRAMSLILKLLWMLWKIDAALSKLEQRITAIKKESEHWSAECRTFERDVEKAIEEFKR